MELPDPPEGWRLVSLIDISEGPPLWSARFSSTCGEYTHGSGTTPRYAMLAGIARILDDDVYAPLEDPGGSKIDLLQVLKIDKPAVVVDRRG